MADLLGLRASEGGNAVLCQVLAGGVGDLGRRNQILLGQLQFPIILYHAGKTNLQRGSRINVQTVYVPGCRDFVT